MKTRRFKNVLRAAGVGGGGGGGGGKASDEKKDDGNSSELKYEEAEAAEGKRFEGLLRTQNGEEHKARPLRRTSLAIYDHRPQSPAFQERASRFEPASPPFFFFAVVGSQWQHV